MRLLIALCAVIALTACSGISSAPRDTANWHQSSFDGNDGDRLVYRCEPEATKELTSVRAEKAHKWHMAKREAALGAILAGVMTDSKTSRLRRQLKSDGKAISKGLFEKYRCIAFEQG